MLCDLYAWRYSILEHCIAAFLEHSLDNVEETLLAQEAA